MEPDLERSLRRARWTMRAFRLIFYPGAAVIAFLLLTGGGEAEAEKLTKLSGHTNQANVFNLWTHDGRPRQFQTEITAVCPNGSLYTLDWSRHNSELISFDERTGTLDATWKWKGDWSNGMPANADARLHGRLDEYGVSGTLRLIDHRDGYDCDSDVVSFSAD